MKGRFPYKALLAPVVWLPFQPRFPSHLTYYCLIVQPYDEDEMVGWHHRLDGHGFEQALGVGDGQGGLACCSPWGGKESDMTERLN